MLDVLVDVGVLHALEGALDQQFQLIEVAAEFGLKRLVVEQLDAQAQAGDRRAQVVGNGAEQLAALGQVTADALAHAVERPAHLDHFAATAFGHWRHICAQRHLPRSPRQALEWPALPVHQQADEQQQQGGSEHDEADLLTWQALGLQAGIRLGQQRGDVQPLALAQAYLRYQYRRIERFQGQRVMRPGAWQFVELEAAVEDAQVIGPDELHGNFHLRTQALVQHLLEHVDHRLLARGDRQYLHVQRRGVERYEEARATHAAQLVEHQRSVGHRQRAEVADTGTHRMGQAAGAGAQALQLAGA
ncbi:hypothetical protein D9M71_472470 [compost metagenome]